MSRPGAYETYVTFLALKNHFTTASYDYFKYHGKLNTKKETFLKRKDRFFYQKLSRKVSRNELLPHIVSNILAGKKWIREFTDDESVETRVRYQKVEESLTYTFENEVDNLFTVSGPREAFRSVDGQLPPVMIEFISGRLSIQTLVILNSMVKFTSNLDKQLEDDYIWSQYSMLVDKYQPFLHFDTKKFQSIFREKIKDFT